MPKDNKDNSALTNDEVTEYLNSRHLLSRTINERRARLMPFITKFSTSTLELSQKIIDSEDLSIDTKVSYLSKLEGLLSKLL